MFAQSSSTSLTSLSKQLLEASRNGNDNDVRALMTQGAPFTSDWLGTSPLHLACMNGHLSTAQILTRAGVSWDGRTKADKTPMHFAAQNGHHEIVSTLIKLGANINAIDMLQMTPIHWAVVEEHFLVIKLFVEHNANLNVKNKFDKTPIETAEDSCKFHIVEYLKSSMNHQPYEDVSVSTSSDTDTSSHVLASLAALSGSPTLTDSWMHQENVASGASVLLEGANMITLTEAGKLALQSWSRVYEDEHNKEVEDTSEASVVDERDNEPKVLSLTLANQMLNLPTSSLKMTNQPLRFVVTSPNSKTKSSDRKSSARKRKSSSQNLPKDKERGISLATNPKELQRKLVAAQTEVEMYREKLQIKEQEAHLWRKRFEIFQQSRT